MKKRNLSPLQSPEMGALEKTGTELAARITAEGSILLENNGVLPMEPRPVALYGYGARLTMVRGIGSGDITYRYTVTIEEGLNNNGFTVTSTAWLDAFDRLYADYRKALLEDVAAEAAVTGVDNLHTLYARPHRLVDSQDITPEDIALSGTDTAVYVISRKEGEGIDNVYGEGEYKPSAQELKQLRQLRDGYAKLILVLNTGTSIEMTDIQDIGPDAVLQLFQGGAEIGNVLGGLLSGKYNPSGKTTSTWIRDYFEYPNSRHFGANDGDPKGAVYDEGLYIGYRYYDSFGTEPQYPFGYGLSYTTFSMEASGMKSEGSLVTLRARITNTGTREGKEVAELYLSSPLTGLEKPYQQLVSFAKTKDLKPGETQELEISFRMEDVTVFSEKKSAYLLEEGDYILRLGNSSRNTRVAGVIHLLGERITRKVKRLFESADWVDELKAPGRSYNSFELAEQSCAPHLTIDPEDIPSDGKICYSEEPTNYFGGPIGPEKVYKGAGKCVDLELPESISLEDVRKGKYSVEEMVASMDAEELIHLVMGEEFRDPRYMDCGNGSYHVPGAAGETTGYFIKNRPEREIPYTIAADGPAGLRLITRIQTDEQGEVTVINPLFGWEGGEFVTENTGYREDYQDYYQYVTGLPISVQLASTWNLPLLQETGRIVGQEMERYDVDLWLAPGLNLHRNPICGRNFEYFSEDPYLSAAVSIALVKGLQSIPGSGATIKHLACNNQETSRTAANSIVRERTMRELYLRGFELTVKYADPYAIMTSLNCVNGPHGTNSRELATCVVRDEWRFKGLITTDWNTTKPARGGSTTGVINAGNDIMMPGSQRDVEKLRAALFNLSGSGDAVSLGALQKSAAGVLRYILRTRKV